jgi:hypothetical protein
MPRRTPQPELHPPPAASAGEGRRIPAPACRLADRFAAFLKASFVYPRGHRRTGIAASEFLATLGDMLAERAPGSSIQIHFPISRPVLVDHEPVQVSGSAIDWCRSLYLRIGQTGVEVRADLRIEDLAEYATRLQDALRSVPIASLDAEDWSDRRIRPALLTFHGGHGGPADGHATERGTRVGAVATAGDDAAGGAAPATLASRGADGRDLLPSDGSPELNDTRRALHASLLRSKEIESKLRELRAEAQRLGASETPERATAPLAEIVARLSTDVVHDPVYAKHTVLRILDAATTALMTGGATDLEGTPDFDRTLRAVAGRWFDFRPSPQDAAATEPEIDVDLLPEGRPEDERHEDRPEGLLAELATLPGAGDGGTKALPPADQIAKETEVEAFAIDLHLIRTVSDGVARRRYEESLLRRLGQASPRALAVLDTYLDAALAAPNDAALWRIVDVLRRNGEGALLLRSGHLTADVVVFAFPDLFSTYVDSIDPAVHDDLVALGNVMWRIGEERVEREADALCAPAAADTLTTEARIERLLATGRREALPLAARFVQHGDGRVRARVATFLRRFDLPQIESLALRAVRPASRLPAGYLEDLCRTAWLGQGDEDLREYSELLLRQFVETATAPELLRHRLLAIEQLRLLPSTSTIRLLERLRGTIRDAILGDEARRLIRAAAIRTLKEILG